MAESSACLMRSFSQPSSTSQDSQEGDPLRHALTTSVSFGRFMSESLAWGKWSSFTQNRYLEDAEKYSRPGSVAEKKAYFEAHYKRKAAQTAAASLEQQNAAVNDTPTSSLTNVVENNSLIQMAQGQDGCYVAIQEGRNEEDPASDLNIYVDECRMDKCAQSPLKGYNIESDQLKGSEQGIEQPTFAESLIEFSILPECGQSAPEGCGIENDQTEVTERGIEQPDFVENQVESSILPEYGRSPQRKCRIENKEIDGTEQEMEHPTFVQKQVKSSAVLEDAQCIIDQQEVKAPAQDAATMEVSAFSDKKKPASASTKSSGHRQVSRLRPPLKPTTPIQLKSGDQATSYRKSAGRESVEKKTSTPKSLHMSINFGSRVGDTNKLSSPEIQKGLTSRLARNLSRTNRENTKQQTPTRASTSGVSKHLSATKPAMERTRKVLVHPISESVTRDRKSESLYMRSSLSSTTCSPKAQHPIISTSFNLRTEERAAKRKEKLQQKLSMEAAEKENPQARVKGKVRNDAKDVLQATASQGKANTSFHLGVKPLDVQMQKIIRTQPCSPGIERKQDSEVLHNHSRPTWRHSVKADSFKDLLGTNHLPPTHSTKIFLRKKCTNENTSPNIQM